MLGPGWEIRSPVRKMLQPWTPTWWYVKRYSTGLSLGLSLLAYSTGPHCLPCAFSKSTLSWAQFPWVLGVSAGAVTVRRGKQMPGQ